MTARVFKFFLIIECIFAFTAFLVQPIYGQSCTGKDRTSCTAPCQYDEGLDLCQMEDPEIYTGTTQASSMFGTADPLRGRFSNIGSIVNKLMPFLLTGAGLVLFGMLIAGGFDMLLAASDAKKVEAGKARITAALTGFVIIFAAYWITQILEVLLGIKILSQ